MNTTSQEQLLELKMLGTSCFSEQHALALKSEAHITLTAPTSTGADAQCQQGVWKY
jgi:hypothetical protein